MKYIFDFDDVLFKNTEMLKPRMFQLIAVAGIDEETIKGDYYRPEVRWQQFSLLNFIKKLFTAHNITGKDPKKLYEEIMSECHNFLNMDLVEEIKKLGKENCYIVTNGEDEFNWDKLRYSGILNYINEENVRVVPDTKKDAIKEICDLNRESRVLFIDDKAQFTQDINFADCPNLTTIVYRGEKLDFI